MGMKPVERLDQHSDVTSLGSGECSLSEESGVVKSLEGPTGRAVEKGVLPIHEVPTVAGEEDGGEEELHPFWQLLELAGYELW